jgi:hypothetical protein
VLKSGDVVQVRSQEEILATLDADATLDAMPFMPEMLRHAGRRFTVSRRVEKICDTVSGGPPNSRRMRDTVLLDDLRCDGSGHGGCQAGCRLYWKEAWLRRVDPDSDSTDRGPDPLTKLEQLAQAATVVTREGDEAPRYRCQATEALRATEPLRSSDPRQYVREVRSENVGALRLLRVAVRAFLGAVGRLLRLSGYRPLRQDGSAIPARGDLDLQPGDTVEVRSKKEIARTLDDKGKTRGLWFDWEMKPYCGSRHRVLDRVERIIDERTGSMIEISSDCVILEGAVCSGEHSQKHWFCPRATYPYWREAWLQRVKDTDTSTSNGSGNSPNAGSDRNTAKS